MRLKLSLANQLALAGVLIALATFLYTIIQDKENIKDTNFDIDSKNYYEKLYLGTSKISGKYKNKKGASFEITKDNKTSTYTIIANDLDDYTWEGVGYYSVKCRCIKSVFRYTSHEEDYGDNNGYHKFEIKNNGDTLIRYGGWNSITEFGDGLQFFKIK